MKRFVAVAIVVNMAFYLAACGKTSEANITTQNIPQPTTSATTNTTGAADLSAIGNIEVDSGVFDVSITIPADFVGETTQEELTAKAKDSDIHSITLNADGSATYTMSKKQHKQLLDQISDSINENLKTMVGSEGYETVTDIKAEQGFTKFVVTTTSKELGIVESTSVLGFYMLSGMYAAFSGETVENVSVDFINADSGAVIETFNSSDMAG
ncbi:MAG: hypothetical protein ABT01_08620 [Clostridium sp. SCN 57-10]|nr:MAG: hypothetical protein ABT01_08620 [Clostridium sp. SCN 57-10]